MKAVNVLETNILHASDVIYWLDGATANTESQMLRIGTPLDVQFSTRPRDMKTVNAAGKTALLRRPTTPIVDGVATEEQKARTDEDSFAVAGIVSDPNGRFIPRAFAFDAGNAIGHALVLYPSPQGVRFPPAGGLVGNIRFHPAGTAAAWAMLTLTVTVGLGSDLTFRGQADGNGDFLLPLNRLPPLPEGITEYSATLSITALASATGNAPIDPADLETQTVGELGLADDPPESLNFSNPIGFNVVPGEIRVIRSASLDHIAVQPS